MLPEYVFPYSFPTRGRYFDEATLPPPAHASLAPPPSFFPAAHDSKAQSVAGITPPPIVDGGVNATDADQRETRVSNQPGETAPGVGRFVGNATALNQHLVSAASPKTSQGLDVPTPPTAPSIQSPRADQKASVSVPETPLSSQEHDGTEIKVSPCGTRAVTGTVPSLEVSADTLPGKKRDTRPSLTLGPSHTEPPLSPASSAGPYSNNTPVPVAASPDTSPAEEAPDVIGKFGQSQQQDRSVQAHPSLVPSTPDEQLCVEEAQSLQQSVEAQKAGDRVNAAGFPSANEVLQESVDPASGPDKDRMEVDQEPAPALSEGVAMESLSPTALPEGAHPIAGPVPEVSTAKKPQPAPAAHPGLSQPERMTTRVSSGAIRHKSVSEILGEPAKATGHAIGSGAPDAVARLRLKDRKDRERERSKLSTVVFPKQPLSQQDKAESLDLIQREAGDPLSSLNEEQDYLFTLFLNKAYGPPRGTNLNTLLASAHKTLSTSNHLVEYQEQMDTRTLRRIYSLQNANRWPLRQLRRSVEPARQGTHWDVLLDHVKWMRTDFREERKWKIATAKSCAEWCAEYVNSDEEHRALLRVNAKIPSPNVGEKDTAKTSPTEDTGDDTFGASHPTPDLVPSAEVESVSDCYHDESRHDLHDTVAPAAIFSLGSDEFNFSIDITPAAEKLLDELPIYTPVQVSPETKLPTFKAPPDSIWKTDLLPVSKFATTKISFRDHERPRKRSRSRYDYSQYDTETEHRVAELPPEQTDVALFRPEHKHIRDRIHPGHSFRPPTEHPMPSVGFFESRQSSQWTYAEDDELRRLVKEYSYNWSLISSCLTPSSSFTSGAERRTPWECFERWVGLEGLPADMSKTQYFRAYYQRLETAQRTVLAQQQAAQQAAQQQQQQQGNNAQPQPPIRRRTTQPLRVDRRRSSKHLALLDAMRKLAKKRETILQKQQHGMFGNGSYFWACDNQSLGKAYFADTFQRPIWLR